MAFIGCMFTSYHSKAVCGFRLVPKTVNTAMFEPVIALATTRLRMFGTAYIPRPMTVSRLATRTSLLTGSVLGLAR